MQQRCISNLGANENAEIRRQKMTTWGIVALAVFVSVGMAEWSKRTAATETVIDPTVMKEAIKIAAARDSGVKGFRAEGNSDFGMRNSEKGDGLRPSYAASPLRGAATEGFGDREEKIQTNAGE